VSGQQNASAALYPRERPGIRFTGGWVGPRVGVDGRKISSPLGFFLRMQPFIGKQTKDCKDILLTTSLMRYNLAIYTTRMRHDNMTLFDYQIKWGKKWQMSFM